MTEVSELRKRLLGDDPAAPPGAHGGRPRIRNAQQEPVDPEIMARLRRRVEELQRIVAEQHGLAVGDER
ncbi:MAG TPA: hypothetical protein VG371_16420 [Solirubrobacteraceae bacterium]|nr:hypothetical protein [Solirubrobacteraceae bacterium]